MGLENSLKNCVREKRGTGPRRLVKESATVPTDWQNFLKNSTNKDELFQYLANAGY